VAAAIAEGKSVEEMVDTILMGDYADMIEYESSRALNVLGVYELLITAQDYPE
jgi:hypothetical protein